MKTKIIGLLLGVVFLAGCGVLRVGLVEMSKEDVKNAEATREAAINFAITWEANSGFIQGALGTRIAEFPWQFVVAMDELDTMFVGEKDANGKVIIIMTKEEKKAKIESMSDHELFYGLGLRVRTLETLIQETLKVYAPDVFDLVPFPLKF